MVAAVVSVKAIPFGAGRYNEDFNQSQCMQCPDASDTASVAASSVDMCLCDFGRIHPKDSLVLFVLWVPPRCLVASPSHPVQLRFVFFSVLVFRGWISEFNPLKVRLLAGDLRTAQATQRVVQFGHASQLWMDELVHRCETLG